MKLNPSTLNIRKWLSVPDDVRLDTGEDILKAIRDSDAKWEKEYRNGKN